MTTLTMKFGGTSVGSAEALTQAAAIVLEQAEKWDRLAVVVSAMSGVTDALTRGALTAASGDEQSYRAITADLRVRHYRDTARLEVPLDRLADVVARRDAVVAAVKAAGYRHVTLDLVGLRSGNLNAALAITSTAFPGRP